MNNGVPKRIVVIKDIPSNLIEEAILILKNDPGQKEHSAGKSTSHKKAASDNFLVKEAEMIINDYIRQNSVQPHSKTKPKRLPVMENKKLMTNIIINVALVGSIAIFILMLTKLF
ncbi:MAG: hypothetical protein N2484_18095 [Clostridia bacterium]|nr:hypothetical protein [Clostridia bacterium]